MRKESVDRFTARRPFQPFEIRLVDGQRFQFTKVEQLLVSRSEVATLDRKGSLLLISLGLIATIGPLTRGGRRRARRAPGNG
jgi:hypothetical protein